MSLGSITDQLVEHGALREPWWWPGTVIEDMRDCSELLSHVNALVLEAQLSVPIESPVAVCVRGDVG